MLEAECLPRHSGHPVLAKRWTSPWVGAQTNSATADWPASLAVSSGVAAGGLIVAGATTLGVSVTPDWQATSEVVTRRRSNNPIGRKLNGLRMKNNS